MAKKAEATASKAEPEIPATPPAPAPAPASDAPPAKKPFVGRGGWKPPAKKPTGNPRGRPPKARQTPAAAAAPAPAPAAQETGSSAVGWWVLAGTVAAAAGAALTVYLTKKVRLVVHTTN